MSVHSFCVVVHVHDVVLEILNSYIWITKCDDKSVCSVVHIYSLQWNSIGVEGAWALGEGFVWWCMCMM